MEKKTVSEMKDATLSHLSAEYKGALLYVSQLRRAIDCFPEDLPPDSPYRYLRKSVLNAIVDYLTRTGRAATVEQLVTELEAGSCIFGATRPEDIVGRVVRSATGERLEWMDRSKTKVGLIAWKRAELLNPSSHPQPSRLQPRRQQ